jgi:hypothetical protein
MGEGGRGGEVGRGKAPVTMTLTGPRPYWYVTTSCGRFAAVLLSPE